MTFVGPWDSCPVNLQNVMKGDKGKGLLYEVVVDHSRRVLSVEGGYFGTINDKCSVKYSKIVNALKNNELYQDFSYRIRTGDGPSNYIELSSYYLISDGGYLQWPCIICGFPPDSDPIKYKFSDWIESVRKDVECFFGILKLRFRWLKCPIKLHQKVDIDNAFVTCCILHNMILQYDGLDNAWEDDINWKTLNPNDNCDDIGSDSEDEDNGYNMKYSPTEHDDNEPFEPITIGSLIDADTVDDIDNASFEKLRCLIANHLHRIYRRGELKWPKPRHVIKKKHNLLPRLNFPCGKDL